MRLKHGKWTCQWAKSNSPHSPESGHNILGWSDFALFSIIENLHIYVDQENFCAARVVLASKKMLNQNVFNICSVLGQKIILFQFLFIFNLQKKSNNTLHPVAGLKNVKTVSCYCIIYIGHISENNGQVNFCPLINSPITSQWV